MSIRLAGRNTSKPTAKRSEQSSTGQWYSDSSGRLYAKTSRGIVRVRGVNAGQLLTNSQQHFKRAMSVMKYQRIAIWTLVVLAVVIYLVKR